MKKGTSNGPDQNGAVPVASPDSPSTEHDMPGHPRSIAGVIGVVPGEVSAEEKARARQMLNALEQMRERFPRPPGDATQPRPRSLSDTRSDDVKPKRTKLDDALAPALAEAGYKKIAKLTYRGEWSTPDVEHVLTFETYGVPKIYLSGSAGLRNPGASAFAEQCADRYAMPLATQFLREGRYTLPPWFCPTHFNAGVALFGWGISGQLDMSAYPPSEVAAIVTERVRSKLVPFVGGVVSLAALLEFVDRNEEPVLWIRTGGCVQAAIVAYLAAALGLSREATRARLRRKAYSMIQWLDKPRITPETYIEHILDDAEAAVAQQSAYSALPPRNGSP